MSRALGLAALALALAGCKAPPPRVLATAGYEVRLPEAPDDSAHAFGRSLRELDERLRGVYGVAPPHGEVWVDPAAFKAEPIGGTYDWFSDRIVLVEPDEAYLAHELVHRYNRYAFGDLPRWLDEGIAYALVRGGLAHLEHPERRRPDFEAIAEVREARAAGALPPMAHVFEDPYANGHLNVRIATVVVDRMLRDRARTEPTMSRVLSSVVRAARELSPGGAAAILERGAFADFPREDELRALLADETASDELLAALLPPLGLDRLVAAAAPDPRARRRLALVLDRERESQEKELRYLESLLSDPDPRVARAAVYSLGARGDRRVVGLLVEVLKDAPLFRFVRPHPRGGRTFEAIPVHRTLAKLAGEVPPGVNVDAVDEAQPLPYRTIEAWDRWWAGRASRESLMLVPALRRAR